MMLPLTPRLAVFARWIPADLVAADSDLAARYLGDDIDETCAAAALAGDPRILASAVHPLEIRLEALKAWRMKCVGALLGSNATLGEFFNEAAPEVRESIRNGQVALAEFDGLVSGWRAEVQQRRNDARNVSKNALRAGIVAALRDCDGTEEGPIVPGFLAILENGEVGLFRRRSACTEWARASGGRFLMGSFERGSMAINPGPEVD